MLAGQLDEKVLALDRAEDCFARIASDPLLECNLPRRGCLAGSIMTHAIRATEKVLAEQGPVVFKFGFTHCPSTRLRNKRFGYIKERQKWERMMILYASAEAIGPSFLEAALVSKYKGSLSAIFAFPFSSCSESLLGMDGCRNERSGGETVIEDYGGPYFTYLIYQSFRRPSTAGSC